MNYTRWTSREGKGFTYDIRYDAERFIVKLNGNLLMDSALADPPGVVGSDPEGDPGSDSVSLARAIRYIQRHEAEE